MENSITVVLVLVVFLFLWIVAISTIWFFSSNTNFAKIKENVKKRFNQKKITEQERENFIFNLAETLMRLSDKKIGALIIYEQRNSLSIYEDSGFKIESKFDIEFVIAVFSNKKASFHDGALIVSNANIKAISCYVPITKESNYSKHGARHRAALGISEITDSISFVVSETTGNISFAKKGELNSLGKTREEIDENLKRLI
ncbi:MAG: DNA integrity scanning protein DisA nucleotide-binding domain protein [Malacoplasma sp.]|nr:DNA integrity scanning protein DisA nucleotide-binding domain protein [Malacoplasma sp.]